MRVKKPRKPVRCICIDCGSGFSALTSKALRCPECREAVIKASKRESMKKIRKHTNKPVQFLPKMSIGEVLRELESYNKANGTHLSYGQFVPILEKGVLHNGRC